MTTAALSNWSGNYTYRAPRVHRPDTVEQLQELVAGAGRAKALGSRHCFNDIADTQGDLIDVTALPVEVLPDRAAGTVRVSAGTSYGALAVALHRESLALANLASLPHISVAGAVATGTHGSGVGNQTLAAAVTGMELVRGSGELLTMTRADEAFAGSVVSLGALGVFTTMTLAVEPTFDVRQDVFENLPWAELRTHFDAIVGAAYSVSLFTDLVGPAVSQVWCKSRITDTGSPTTDSAVFDAAGVVRRSFFGAAPATVARHPLPGLPGDVCTGQLGISGPWYERLPHFQPAFTPSSGDEVQSEYLVPRGRAVEVIEILRGLGPRIAPLLQVCEIRTVAADDLWLSPAYQQDSVAVHFTWRNDERAVLVLLAEIETALAGCRPRPHWGKLFVADADRLAGRYPLLPDFRRLIDELDPAGVFRNDYLDRLLIGGATG